MQKLKNILKSVAAFGTLSAVFTASLVTLPTTVAAQIQTDAPFTAGNIVVYRVGNGTETLANTGNSVFLDEFAPAGGAPVQSLALPTTVSGANRQLIASGTATSEGSLTRSADGRFLVLTGYGRDLNGTGSLTASAAADVNRIIGRVDASGVIDTTTALTDAATGNNPRSAASATGSDFYIVGGTGGVRYTTLGATTSTQINAGTTVNFRTVNIFGGQLYASSDTATGSPTIVAAVGTGLPTTAGQTLNNLPGIPVSADAGANAYNFFFADLNAGVAGVDVLYIADEETGIRKFSLVGGTWTANGAIGGNPDDYRGITGIVNGANVTLYAVRTGNELVSLIDNTGYNVTIGGTPTVLATAPTGTAFRGVALAPTGGPSGPGAGVEAPVDFNGDNRTDYVVVGPPRGTPFSPDAATNSVGTLGNRIRRGERNSSNDGGGQSAIWYTQINGGSVSQNSGVNWGLTTDEFVPEDFDGDNKSDYAVWRPAPAQVAAFFILQSQTNTLRTERFGQEGDDPTVVADYDGDGKADPAVFRANANNSQATWFYRPSATPATNFVSVPWGLGFDFPAPGDYNGDNRADFAVQRNVNGSGVFYILRSNDLGTEALQWGFGSDVVVPGDYDGDNRTDLCVVRIDANQGANWYILERDGGMQYYLFGTSNDVPTPGDYNGDGRTDISVWRRSATPGQTVFITRPAGSVGTSDIYFQWGAQSDIPAANFTVQ